MNHIFLHKFIPNETLQWWKTDLKSKNGIEFRNLSVRLMEMDIQTELIELKQLLELNTNFLNVYQFDKPISDTLQVESLPENSKDKILKKNGLKHWFFIHFEMITISSFDDDFIEKIETNPLFSSRITQRKLKSD